jgi:hypothetical protein
MTCSRGVNGALEEPAVCLDQRDQGHRHAEQAADQSCQSVEHLLGRDVEQTGPPQRVEARRVTESVILTVGRIFGQVPAAWHAPPCLQAVPPGGAS